MHTGLKVANSHDCTTLLAALPLPQWAWKKYPLALRRQMFDAGWVIRDKHDVLRRSPKGTRALTEIVR